MPIANPWKPYQVMKDIWTRSHPQGMNPHLLLPWWVLWLGGNAVGGMSFVNLLSGGGPTTPESIIREDFFQIVSDGVMLLAFLLVIVLVWQVTNAQERKLREPGP